MYKDDNRLNSYIAPNELHSYTLGESSNPNLDIFYAGAEWERLMLECVKPAVPDFKWGHATDGTKDKDGYCIVTVKVLLRWLVYTLLNLIESLGLNLHWQFDIQSLMRSLSINILPRTFHRVSIQNFGHYPEQLLSLNWGEVAHASTCIHRDYLQGHKSSAICRKSPILRQIGRYTHRYLLLVFRL